MSTQLIPSKGQEGEISSMLSPSVWWFLIIFGIPWLVEASPWSPSTCSYGLLPVYLHLLIRTPVILDRSPPYSRMTSSELVMSITPLFLNKITFWDAAGWHFNVWIFHGHNIHDPVQYSYWTEDAPDSLHSDAPCHLPPVAGFWPFSNAGSG